MSYSNFEVDPVTTKQSELTNRYSLAKETNLERVKTNSTLSCPLSIQH